MTPAISIGKQDFASLRENHYFYVDKTDFIQCVVKPLASAMGI